jgi:hypothetical protein
MSARVYISGSYSRDKAKRLIDDTPSGYVVEIREPTRTDDQNRKLWPMLEDIRQQVPGMEEYSRDDIKLRFLNALGMEMRFLPALEGNGLFPVGLRSSSLTKDQFSALIELLYMFGAKHGVIWTDPNDHRAAA